MWLAHGDRPSRLVTGPGDEVGRRLRAQTTQLWAPPGVIDLGIGQPQNDILPLEHIRQALLETASHPRGYPLQYGIERGDGYLRIALSAFLSEQYGSDQAAVDPELMFVTNGNSQAIDLCCATFTEPGDVVLVEEPTYFLALEIFRNHRLTVVGVPMDESGLRLDALEDAVIRHSPALIYTIPSAQNPTGATLPDDRRRRLVELAARHGVLILADEVYELLRYDPRGDPPKPLAAYLDSGVVLSLNTFSKILAPGLRLGWIQAAEPLLARLETRGYLVSGGGLNPFSASIVARMLDAGAVTLYLDRLRATFRERIAVLDEALGEQLPQATFRTPDAGYFFWLRFPEGVDTSAVRPRARELGTGFQPGAAFSTRGELHEYLRLSFAYYGSEDLRTAARLLGQAFAG